MIDFAYYVNNIHKDQAEKIIVDLDFLSKITYLTFDIGKNFAIFGENDYSIKK